MGIWQFGYAHYCELDYKTIRNFVIKHLYMSRAEIIEKTINALNKLPESKGEEVADFADFMVKKSEEQQLQNGIHHLVQNSASFAFLNDEEDLYTLDDLKEKY